MLQMFPWCEHLLVLSQVSRVTAGQFFSTHKTCKHHKRFTSSSSGAGTAMSGACCRLSAASLLCDLPAERDRETLQWEVKEANASHPRLAHTFQHIPESTRRVPTLKQMCNHTLCTHKIGSRYSAGSEQPPALSGSWCCAWPLTSTRMWKFPQLLCSESKEGNDSNSNTFSLWDALLSLALNF